MIEYWSKEEVVDNLWSEYSKSSEFLAHKFKPVAIEKDHPIVISREQSGLLNIIDELKKSLREKKKIYLDTLKSRKPNDWIRE